MFKKLHSAALVDNLFFRFYEACDAPDEAAKDLAFHITAACELLEPSDVTNGARARVRGEWLERFTRTLNAELRATAKKWKGASLDGRTKTN